MTKAVPAHQALAQSLTDHRVNALFGLMGDANLFMVDHWMRHHDGRFISVAHEGSAVLMALGYAQVTGEIGVATVTHGPAVTNCVTALVEGVKGRIPIVLLAGDTPAENVLHHQNVDQRELFKATGAGFEQMRSASTATQDLARAFYRARAERRPVVLNMPVDFMWEDAGPQAAPFEAFEQPKGIAQSDVVDEAVGMIASARRPLIIAGGGAMGAKAELVALADRLEAPVATTLRGNGLFADHPANIGIIGTLSTPAAYEVMAQSDCVIAFGAGLHYYTTDHGKLLKDKRLVQVDIDPAAVGRGMHPDAALIADAGPAAELILYWLNEAEVAPSGFSKELDSAALRHHPTPSNRTPDGFVNYVEAIQALEQALPPDRIVVTDVGRFMTEIWARMTVPDPQSFVPTTHFTCIGLGLQEAIGASVAKPDRTVVAFCGDGGFMLGGINELHTAIRLGLNMVIIVANDSAYGAEHIQFEHRQMDPGSSHLDWPGFADVARSMGAQAVRVDGSEALSEALEMLTTREGVALIELVLDPADVPPLRV
ncbi:MAG: thiamine pyrophosphate-binding protein [Pseudomonadota bacterium]